MQLVALWTDIFVWIFVVLSLFILIKKRKSPLFRVIGKKIFNQSRYMIAFIIVLSFVIIGLLDSIHFKTKNSQIYSVLDVILSPRNKEREKTYSAPFALVNFSNEVTKNAKGQLIEVSPPLKYAGQNLKNPNDKAQDILRRIFIGLLIALCLTLASFYLFKNKIRRYFAEKVYRSFWPTLFILFSIICIFSMLMFEYHVFGTDKVGRDVFYITLKSIRTGLVIGTVTTLVMLPFALTMGIWAGYFRGIIDDIIQYLYTTLGSIPGILLIAAAVVSFQVKIEEDPDLKLLTLCIILGATGWIGLCRLLRGETLKLREAEFIQAARVLGIGDFKIIFKHILPNLMHIVIITVILEFSGLVLAESVLSYIGVGVSPSSSSWGNMINAARLEMAREPMVWWSLASAFIFMFTLVFSVNILGDAVQDALNPKASN